MTNQDQHLDYYAILGLEYPASPSSITSAYRKKARKIHPDKNPDNPAGATRDFNILQEAYDCLHDPIRRAEYDVRFKAKLEKERRDADRREREAALNAKEFVRRKRMAADLLAREKGFEDETQKAKEEGGIYKSCC
jgi:DnaJ family protein C protein 17